MLVYPVPVEVTQARVQLLVDQAAKAPPNTINEDLKAVYDAKSKAVQNQNAQQAQIDEPPPVEQSAPAETIALVDVKV